MFVLENLSSLLIGIFVLILLIMSILMPFFIFQIRDYTLRIKKEIIKLNESMSLLNDNIIAIGKNSAITVELQQGGSLSQCSWCKKTFPSSQAKIHKDIILCPDCANKQTLLKRR